MVKNQFSGSPFLQAGKVILVCKIHPLKKFQKAQQVFFRREIRWIPQEMLNRVVDNFNVRVATVLSYSSVVHGTNTVLITEKVE